MSNHTITIYDALTGETIVRELTKEEIANLPAFEESPVTSSFVDVVEEPPIETIEEYSELLASGWAEEGNDPVVEETPVVDEPSEGEEL